MGIFGEFYHNSFGFFCVALLECSSGVQSECVLFKKQSSVGILDLYHLIHYVQVIHYIKVRGGCLAFIAVILEWLMQPEYFLSSH